MSSNKPINEQHSLAKTKICRVCYKKFYVKGKVPVNFTCNTCFIKEIAKE